MKYTMVASCLLGVEGIVADELRRMDAENVRAENGRVLFEGDANILARANINLRTAERVLLLLGEFNATSFEELFENVRKINFEDFIGAKDAFPVKGYSRNSKLYSVPDCQKIIKKAIVERLKSAYGVDWFEESRTVYRIQFSIVKDKACIMLDTSGESLHKRGYRPQGSAAPIRETLAAAMVNIARVRDRAQLYDPFCGSGTILIEGAMAAMNIAPGIHRTFVSDRFGFIDRSVWNEERTRAIDSVIKDAEFHAYGSDIDPHAIALTELNAKRAGVESRFTLKTADIGKFEIITDKAFVITNPPYGERLLTEDEAREIYKKMGKVMTSSKGKSYNIISPDEQFEHFFGRKADKKRKLYNGMIKCNYFIYFR